jgi:hypothetical protein
MSIRPADGASSQRLSTPAHGFKHADKPCYPFVARVDVPSRSIDMIRGARPIVDRRSAQQSR